MLREMDCVVAGPAGEAPDAMTRLQQISSRLMIGEFPALLEEIIEVAIGVTAAHTSRARWRERRIKRRTNKLGAESLPVALDLETGPPCVGYHRHMK